jgi:hypothetical protein
MKKSKRVFQLEKHPTVFGHNVTSNKAVAFAILLILTGIFAPVGIVLYLTAAHHRSKKPTPASKKKRKR